MISVDLSCTYFLHVHCWCSEIPTRQKRVLPSERPVIMFQDNAMTPMYRSLTMYNLTQPQHITSGYDPTCLWSMPHSVFLTASACQTLI